MQRHAEGGPHGGRQVGRGGAPVLGSPLPGEGEDRRRALVPALRAARPRQQARQPLRREGGWAV